MENTVYAGLCNGQIAIFRRDSNGLWLISGYKLVTIDAGQSVNKMLSVARKLWCGIQNQIKILSPSTLEVEVSLQIITC